MSRIALLIANAAYANMPDLECCSEDLTAIETLLVAAGRYDFVRTLQDSDADTIKTSIRDAVEGDVDEIFFYFSGHGLQVDKEFYFCATDFEKTRPGETGLSNGELHALLRAANPDTVIKVIDACSSGTLLIKSGGAFLPVHKEGLKNLIQISSCLDEQAALTGDPLSEFTRSFCRACLTKEAGPLFYTDIIKTLRDEYLGNDSQTPHFTSQGTGREVFVEDAAVLASFREAFDSRWHRDSPGREGAAEGGDGDLSPAPPQEPPVPPGNSRPQVSRWQRLFEVGEIAIDLGTANTRIILANEGIVLDEPSLIAVEDMGGWKRVKAVGHEVESIQSAREENVKTIRPLRDGVIADDDAAAEMIKHFLRRVREKHDLPRRLEVIVSTPAGATTVERAAVRDVIFGGTGARKIRLIDAPMAAAIGADMPVSRRIASMVVDIGAGKTDAAVLSGRGLAYSISYRTGGDVMDEAISSYIARHHNLRIDARTAERIKNQIGIASWPSKDENLSVIIGGHDRVHAGPMEIAIDQRQIAEALSDSIGQIVEAVREVLSNTAPDHSRDLIDQGIGLTGGVACLSKLDEVIRDETGLPVYVADDAPTCVAQGLRQVLEDHALRSALM